MISILWYVVLYYNIDKLFQYIYLPYITTTYHVNNHDVISNYPELYSLLKITSYFMLLLYSYILFQRMIYFRIYNKFAIGLSFVYVKHLLDIIITPNMTITEYELNRTVMWLFSTPLMLLMYCDLNNLTLRDINFSNHIFVITLYTFSIPFKNINKTIYYIFTIVLSIPEILFIKSLYKYNHLTFTNIYIIKWSIFMLINVLDITQLCDHVIIHTFYNLADTMCKFICNIIISNYNEQHSIINENMDLQSVYLVSQLIKKINQFEIDNKKLTPFCMNLLKYYKKQFIDNIPKTNDKLKLELLSKILPLGLDKDYIRSGSGFQSGSESKEFKFICIMFMDIVNYTELAKKYNGDIIFKLLDSIYTHFDNIIKKYYYLQKIETIGDAYMVVGDIYRNDLNYKIVVKEIILLALDFIKEIQNIPTPDNIPLSIRIGINIGSVNVGILGNEVPRLCIVGNSVNVASRLQSTADTNTIQLSRHVYEHASEIDFGIKIEYIEKQNVFLKNFGSIVTYTIKPYNN